jgi:hypothetical protein
LVKYPNVEILEEKISSAFKTPFLIKWRFKNESHIRCFFPKPGYFLENCTEEEKEKIIQDGFTYHVKAAIQQPEKCPFPCIPFGTPVEFVAIRPYPENWQSQDGWSFSHWDLSKHEADEWIFYIYRYNEERNTVDYRTGRSEMLLSYELDGVKTILNTLEKFKEDRYKVKA